VTNLEALQGVLGEYEASSNTLSVALENSGLNGASTYVASNDKATLNSAAVEVLNGILYSSVSEGGYSKSISAELIKAKIASLGGGPKVNGVSVW
jgi:hypothetical protein